MYSDIDVTTILIQWICLALSGLLAWVAWTAWRMEIEQGLRQSKTRFLATAGLFVVGACFVLTSTMTWLAGHRTPAAVSETTPEQGDGQPPEDTPELQAQRQQLRELETEISRINDELSDKFVLRRQLREAVGETSDDALLANSGDSSGGFNVGA